MLMPAPRDSYSYWSQFGRGLLAGGAAGATVLPFVFPLELCRTRLSTDNKGSTGQRRYRGFVHVMTETVKVDGLRGTVGSVGAVVCVQRAGPRALQRAPRPRLPLCTRVFVISAGLYRGFGIAMVGIVPYRAVYFGGVSVSTTSLALWCGAHRDAQCCASRKT